MSETSPSNPGPKLTVTGKPWQDPLAKQNFVGWNLIFERAIHINPETGEMESYWPEYWDMLKLAAKWRSIGSAAFGAGYQNDPTALDGNMLSASWLHYYTQEELIAERMAAGIQRGYHYIGIDPAGGGESANPDYCAGIVLERIGNKAFAVGILHKRLPIKIQAQSIEEFANIFAPFTGAVIEDIASRGYVYTALTTQINDNKGTKHNFKIEKPQGGNANGNKDRRFLSMGPRFEFGQIRIPGIVTNLGIIPHTDWEPFVQEWKAYPGGHDDILDAMYWAQFACFGIEPVIATSKSAVSQSIAQAKKINEAVEEKICERPAHVRYGQPMKLCYRCTMEAEEEIRLRGDLKGVRESMGAQHYRRNSIRLLR